MVKHKKSTGALTYLLRDLTTLNLGVCACLVLWCGLRLVICSGSTLACVWAMQFAQLAVGGCDRLCSCSRLCWQWETCISILWCAATAARTLSTTRRPSPNDADMMAATGSRLSRTEFCRRPSIGQWLHCKLLHWSGSMLRHHCMRCLSTWLMLLHSLLDQPAQPATMLVCSIGSILLSKYAFSAGGMSGSTDTVSVRSTSS